MHVALVAVAMCTLLFYLLSEIEAFFGNRTIPSLSVLPALSGHAAAPRVTVVIAARDEERGLESALRSVLQQDYPACEVIVVDDRSADGTPEILARLARESSRLRVLTVRQLPPGWLGKNHALHLGASQATGSILLFSDADVVMAPGVLSRAVQFALHHEVDHLALIPSIVLRGFLLHAFLGLFAFFFSVHVKPWKARDPKSSRHIGIGAFNMVRAEVYRSVGGHERIAMRPDDDLKLGKLIKSQGYKQDVIFGMPDVSVEWYDSTRALIRGLMKNMFASVEYSVPAAVGAAAAQLVVGVWPFAALVFTRGSVRILNALIVVCILTFILSRARELGISRISVLGFPLASLLFAYILLRSMAMTLWNGGIEWRGTRYPLAQLRANRV